MWLAMIFSSIGLLLAWCVIRQEREMDVMEAALIAFGGTAFGAIVGFLVALAQP